MATQKWFLSCVCFFLCRHNITKNHIPSTTTYIPTLWNILIKQLYLICDSMQVTEKIILNSLLAPKPRQYLRYYEANQISLKTHSSHIHTLIYCGNQPVLNWLLNDVPMKSTNYLCKGPCWKYTMSLCIYNVNIFILLSGYSAWFIYWINSILIQYSIK